MGYALQLQQESQEELTEQEAAIYLGLTIRERRIARRTFNVFQHWPLALNHLGNMSIQQWIGLRNNEEENLSRYLLEKYPPDNSRLEAETNTSILGSDTESEILHPEIFADEILYPEIFADEILHPEIFADEILHPEIFADEILHSEIFADEISEPEILIQ